MAENPPLNRLYVAGYAANDRDYPIVSMNLDPRVAGYKVPEDLSTCPDKRYPNHVFTGAQPLSGDERVRHVWEILPSPYVPFTRYDDDLGPVQGRRRSVKNEGQVASRETDKQVTYEAREGSAIVYTELEETWSIKTDEDGNSLFPIKDRDFYDASRGPVQERRQLFVPTGEEAGSLENVDGTITQTSYEPYNDFLSAKVVQTYKVDGPQLVGNSTNNEGQLVTVTTQRKGADGYTPPSPTATRTVEANREDAESIVERVVDTPEVFAGEAYSTTREDLTPQKFKAAQSESTFEQSIAGVASPPVLETGEFRKSEQQVTEFVKRISTTNRDISASTDLTETVITPQGQVATRTLRLSAEAQSIQPDALLVDGSIEALGDGRTIKTEVRVGEVFDSKLISSQKPDTIPEKFRVTNPLKRNEEIVEGTLVSVPSLEKDEYFKSEQRLTKYTVQKVALDRSSSYEEINNQRLEEAWGVKIPYTEYISETIPSIENIEAEGLGDDRYLIREYSVSQLDSILGDWSVTIPSSIDINMPRVLEDISVSWQEEKSIGEANIDTDGLEGSFNSLTQRDNGSISSSLTLVPKIEVTFNDPWGSNLPCEVVIFFLKKQNLTIGQILQKSGAQNTWPTFKPKSFSTTVFGISESKTLAASISRALSFTSEGETGHQPTKEDQTDFKRSVIPVSLNLPPCLTSSQNINLSRTLQGESGTISLSYQTVTTSNGEIFNGPSIDKTLNHSISINDSISIPATDPTDIPKTGTYIVNTSIEPFKFEWFLVRATTFDASVLA